jgi:hypothetical protein
MVYCLGVRCFGFPLAALFALDISGAFVFVIFGKLLTKMPIIRIKYKAYSFRDQKPITKDEYKALKATLCGNPDFKYNFPARELKMHLVAVLVFVFLVVGGFVADDYFHSATAFIFLGLALLFIVPALTGASYVRFWIARRDYFKRLMLAISRSNKYEDIFQTIYKDKEMPNSANSL